ncbi:hypothetical protein G5B38_09965 [Pseudohalocynthiibacter aestuariivivens]|nr:hypothetical protein [Pseudohalocynthiibacter aestuariivivens]QIE45825.1 hypothetical protein G5B38_09965 [Pseudohalocynthiibacter aestuariivivens]
MGFPTGVFANPLGNLAALKQGRSIQSVAQERRFLALLKPVEKTDRHCTVGIAMCRRPSNSLARLQDFARLRSEALEYASLLLAGPQAVKQLQSLLEEIFRAAKVCRRLQEEITRTYEMLSLTHIHDPDRVEATNFKELDPSDPFVEELSLMTNVLTELLHQLDLDPGQPLSDYPLAA